MTRTVNIGLIGAGTVGSGVVQALKRNGALMASRLGVRLRVTRVAVRSLRKKRDFKVPPSALTTCLLYTSPSPRDKRQSRMPSSA